MKKHCPWRLRQWRQQCSPRTRTAAPPLKISSPCIGRSDFRFNVWLLLLLLGIAPQTHACDRAATLVTTSAAPRQAAPQARASLESLAALSAQPVNVLFIGDSLVARWPVAVAAKFGVTGDRTQNVLWRLNQPETAKVRARRVVLLVGTNNISAGDAPCAIALGILAAVERISRLWPDAAIDVIGIPARGDKAQFEAARRETNNILRAQIKDARYIDPDAVLTCAEQCASFEKDRVHLSPKGYEALDSLLAEVKR